MKKRRRQKIISYILLLLYVAFLFNTFVLSDNAMQREGVGFTIFRIYDAFINNQINSSLIFDIVCKIILLIPYGVLYPMAKQKKCFSYTLRAGGIMGFVCEILQLICHSGTSCFDDILLSVLGVYLGYKIFLLSCKKIKNGSLYLYNYDNTKDKKWLLILFLCFAFFYIANTVSYDDISSAFDKINTTSSQVANNDSIYQKIYTDLAAHKNDISFFNTYVDADEINNQFVKVIYDHPEFFWLTGGGQGSGVQTSIMTTYHFYPEMACDVSKIPTMENQLNAIVDDITAHANQLDSDYEKALYVHDYIVMNCEYDIGTYFTNAFMQSNKNYSLAYSSYGCLVNRSAVCAGYAKTYQLLMNRLGIECYYVTGIGTTDTTSGDHAWNCIKLDDDYYFVDVTWDDPLILGGSSDKIRRDYFCITTYELSKDHTIDEGQDVPFCAGIKY